MRSALLLCAVVAMFGTAYATLGVDLSSGGCGTNCFSCMHSNGRSFAVVRGWESVGQPDPNVAASVAAAWAGGMAHVDVYMFPCPTCGDPAGQVERCVSNLRNRGVKFGMLWFDIEGPQYWMGQAANREFFNGLISGGHAAGVNIGIYSSASQWDPIFGSFTAGSGYPLWYAHYDGAPNFNDFVPFAGWSHPAIKQYAGDVGLCSFDVDANWYPDGSRENWQKMWPEAFNATRH